MKRCFVISIGSFRRLHVTLMAHKSFQTRPLHPFGRARRVGAVHRSRQHASTPARPTTALPPEPENAPGVKARVEPFRARVQASAQGATAHSRPLFVPAARPKKKKEGSHSRRPLFVLATVRRRRARGSVRRGGYYALPSAVKP